MSTVSDITKLINATNALVSKEFQADHPKTVRVLRKALDLLKEAHQEAEDQEIQDSLPEHARGFNDALSRVEIALMDRNPRTPNEIHSIIRALKKDR